MIVEQKLKAPTRRKRGRQPKASEDQPASSAISMCSCARGFALLGCLFRPTGVTPEKLASTVVPTGFVLLDAFADTSTTIKRTQAVKFIAQQSVPKNLAVAIDTITFWNTVSSHIRLRHTLIMQV